MNMAFQRLSLIIFKAPKPQITLHKAPAVCVFVCVGTGDCLLLSHSANAVCHGAKEFWMDPSHLVTIAETDRGAVGQSGVGVFNELS